MFLLFSFSFVIFLVIFLFNGDQADYEEEFFYNTEEEVSLSYPEHNNSSLEEPEFTASAVLSLYYSESGDEKVIYEKNINEVFPIASISKIMTALVVLKHYNTDSPVNVSGVNNFKAWKETEIYDVVFQMLIESNNVSAFVLASISNRFFRESEMSNSVEFFVGKMNEEADKIGLEKTVFFNPSGLDLRSNYNKSTAREIALLSIYILNNEERIFKILRTPFYDIYSPNGMVYYKSVNTNHFIHNKNKEWSDRIIGGKTGTTMAAGQCLLLVLESSKGDGYLINVILGSEDRFKEMDSLINYVESIYEF